MTRRAKHHDSGIVTVWTAVVAVACLLIVGLVLDGGAVLRARSESFDIAGAAARAGAQELDEVELTEGRVVIDEGAARRRSQEYMAAHGVVGDVVITPLEVQVTVRDTVHLQMLRPASITVTETATVRAAEGGP